MRFGTRGVKRPAWTLEEDRKLLASIEEKGFGNWSSIAKNAGLQRSGKSCRMRWKNRLRPDIKKGELSLQEQETIIHLQARLGNRWTQIANHLSNRTDNDIKNFWNTQKRKRLMLKMGMNPFIHMPTAGPVNAVAGQQFNELKAPLETEDRERSTQLHPGSTSYASTGHLSTISLGLARSEVEIPVPQSFQQPIMGEHRGKKPFCEEFPGSHIGVEMNNYNAISSSQGTNAIDPNLLFPEHSFHDHLNFSSDQNCFNTDLV